LRIHKFTSSEFSCLKEEWQKLLYESSADRLFLSWHWMHSWWKVFGKKDNDELFILGVYTDNNQLIAIAPFYKSKRQIYKYYSTTVLQFIGTRLKGSFGFRTENLEFIQRNNCNHNAIEFIFNYIQKNVKIDELWLHDLVKGSETQKQLSLNCTKYSINKRVQSHEQAYGIDTTGSFDKYISQLGKNTRLKFYNRRKVLEEMGNVTVAEVNKNNYLEALSILSKYHFTRWGHDISYKKHGVFIDRLISNNSSISVCGIFVKLNDETIGCALDFKVENTTYNIQSGFKDNIHKKIAMGSLTLGYLIEQYFNDPKIIYYDFLAGAGKNSNYKESISSPGVKVSTEQLILSKKVKFLYFIKDLIK